MEPHIQYARTSDGVNIAYGEGGEGKAVILMTPPGFGHAEMAMQVFPGIVPPLVENFRTIWLDARGTGLSDRDVRDFSIEEVMRDLEAVVERAGLNSFVLAAWTNAVPIAVMYAKAHSERLSHLVLVDGWAVFSDWMDSPAYRASAALLEMDWHIFTETFGQVVWGYTDSAFGRMFAEYMRTCSDFEAHQAMWKAAEKYDVSDLLPALDVPTLVIHNRNNRLYPLALGRRLAGAIPNARLSIIDDIGVYSPVPELIRSFVSEGEAPPLSATQPQPSGTAVILFADIVESTSLTERLGDAAFRDKARNLDTALRAIISDRSGTPIEGKLLGDGVLAVFTSARQAIEAALACGRAGDAGGLPLHLGLHAGDVIREDNNVYGGAVNIASRISGLSAPDEVLVSETVRSLARTSAGVSFEDRGEQTLKGVGEPVRVWAVREGA